VPTPWEAAYRPNSYGQPAFGKNPDDVVEWIRYAEAYDGSMGGEQFNMFVGRLGGNFNFRGYPERHTPGQDDLRKQLDHPVGEALRLVMELSEGGAGYGDYVTIATSDPKVFEPGLRRVYKVREHEDGRFFVSLLDVGETGNDIASSRGTYQRSYTRSMNPRLVKFPTWGLPEIPTNTAVLFGEALSAAAGPGRSNPGGPPGRGRPDRITIDEVGPSERPDQPRPDLWPPRTVRGRSAEGSSVPIRQTLTAGRLMAPSRPDEPSAGPAEVLVVSVSRERPALPPFSRRARRRA
jgi:hypothetical protein